MRKSAILAVLALTVSLAFGGTNKSQRASFNYTACIMSDSVQAGGVQLISNSHISDAVVSKSYCNAVMLNETQLIIDIFSQVCRQTKDMSYGEGLEISANMVQALKCALIGKDINADSITCDIQQIPTGDYIAVITYEVSVCGSSTAVCVMVDHHLKTGARFESVAGDASCDYIVNVTFISDINENNADFILRHIASIAEKTAVNDDIQKELAINVINEVIADTASFQQKHSFADRAAYKETAVQNMRNSTLTASVTAYQSENYDIVIAVPKEIDQSIIEENGRFGSVLWKLKQDFKSAKTKDEKQKYVDEMARVILEDMFHADKRVKYVIK